MYIGYFKLHHLKKNQIKQTKKPQNKTKKNHLALTVSIKQPVLFQLKTKYIKFLINMTFLELENLLSAAC